ncbi:wd repeat protein [Ophiostoma piceae UAMH 11346]|uniref:Probable cytosolic iron-sulfur protein assembly protein 1 n=1 Tax=Ophiostoma piceae (strain UAMH 11346) TaxID=1262450 RepID=S3CLU0_OPHP1|nr:wd repeat protein [Ophiostoma piceae UAMH 11346]
MDPASAASPAEASAITSSHAADATQHSTPSTLQIQTPSQHAPSSGRRLQSIKEVRALPPFQPDLYQRGWSSIPHPTLPLLATAHNKSVTIFSLTNFTAHSSLTGGHSRSVRSATWKPSLPPNKLCLVTGSFDSTAGLWRHEQPDGEGQGLEKEVTFGDNNSDDDGDSDKGENDAWEFTLVLEGQEHEIKSVAFSPSGQFLATCSRDKSVWIWEDVGSDEDDDEWETVAVLNEHEGDVKCVAWCPDVPGRRSGASRNRYSLEVLASTSYDNTTRIWREDGDGEWVCVAVLEGHEGTVWGVQWETDPERTRFPRLLTWSADQTLRIWTLDEEDEDDVDAGSGNAGGFADGGAGGGFRGLGGVPNTMRRSLHESWTCTAVLPRAHTRDIYSATWSTSTGLVASTGSDGTVIVYAEVDGAEAPAVQVTPEDEAAAMLDGDVINNVVWCRRFDAGTEHRGVEEMLVTTGDDGVVRPWEIVKA